jgi:hypothetical protein
MPVAYASIGTQTTWGNGTTTVSHSHNIVGNALIVSVDMGYYAQANPSVSASINGVPLTMLRQQNAWWSSQGQQRSSIAVLGMLNPPTGPQTITLTVSDPNFYGTGIVNSVSYSGVGSFGSATFAAVNNSAATVTSQSIPTGSMCFNAFQGYKYNAPATLSAYNQTTRANTFAAFQNSMSFLMGDAQGAGAPITFTATSAGEAWYGVTVPLLEATTFDTYATNGTSFSSIPHSAGDLLVMFAHASSQNTTAATPAAGGTVPAWNPINNTAGNSWSNVRTAWAVGTGSSTSGVWTNASMLLCAVIRDANTTTPIGGTAVSPLGIGATMTAPAVTLTRSDGTSRLFHYYGSGDAVNTVSVSAAPAAGYSRKMLYQPTTLLAAVLNTKDVTTTSPAAVQTKVGSTWFAALSIEVLMGSPVPTNQFFQMF